MNWHIQGVIKDNIVQAAWKLANENEAPRGQEQEAIITLRSEEARRWCVLLEHTARVKAW